MRKLEPYHPRKSLWKAILALFFFFFVVQALFWVAEVYLFNYRNPNTTAFIRNYLNQCPVSGKDCPFEQYWKPLGEISPTLQEAVLIGEDDRFFEHEGIDTEAMEESLEANLKKKKIVRGGSTITQQLAKNLFLSSSKNPLRKIKEIVMALLMEKMLSKTRILEIYLNEIEWGKGIYGAEAASLHYFQKPAKNLNAEEAAYLSAIIPNPQLYTTKLRKRAERRKNIILKRMQNRSFEELSKR